jgi:hypothetical protein
MEDTAPSVVWPAGESIGIRQYPDAVAEWNSSISRHESGQQSADWAGCRIQPRRPRGPELSVHIDEVSRTRCAACIVRRGNAADGESLAGTER